MNIREVSQAFVSLGWTSHRDDVGDKYVLYELSDRIVQIIYRLRKYGDDRQLEIHRSISTRDFSRAVVAISCDKREYNTPLAVERCPISVIVPEVTEKEVRQVSAEALEWAKSINVEEALAEKTRLPTDAPGARPLWHLAALSLAGDVEKLKSYQASFEEGDRLGFVPYITKDYIDRAVAFAEEYVAEGDRV